MVIIGLKLILCLLIYYVQVTNTKLQPVSDFGEQSVIYRQLEQMIKLCIRSRLNPVIVTEDIGQQLHLSLDLNDPLSVILVNNNLKINNRQQWYPRQATFFLTVDEIKDIKDFLLILNSSPWWNVKSFFIFVKINSCEGALDILKAAWEKKLLSSLFLCYQTGNDAVKLYTYNPFTNRAPDPWKISKDVDNLHQRWTLYEQLLQHGQKICTNLTFDKLKVMDGYQIKMIGIPIPDSIWKPNENYSVSSLTTHLPYYNGIFFQTLFSVWDVTPIIQYDVLGTVVNGTVIGFLRSFMTGAYDLSYTVFRIDQVYNWSVAYPFRQLSVMIQTQKRHFLKTEEKILSFYSVWILVLTMIVFVLSTVVLMGNKGRKLMAAMLDIFRLVAYTSMLQPLLKGPIRIYFFGVFWLIIVLNATFTGNLATFLTKPERSEIETIEDLQIWKYHTYIEGTLHDMVGYRFRVLEDYLNEIQYLDCHEYVVNNSQAACIALTSRGYKPAFQHQLHVSKPLLPTYRSFIGSLDSPFIEKVDKISSLFIQSGLQAYWDHHASHYFIQNLSATEYLETAPRHRPIKIEDISFAFKLLLIGLGSSLVTFLGELHVDHQFKKRARKVRKIKRKSVIIKQTLKYKNRAFRSDFRF